ncbi:holin [Aureibacillus halotolerans]|uniref:A118-like holin Hol118 n=1 Tax=Aureibacillus halotolerans TaxID=1508390 RepID=A0A4R6TV68_9BACI|nr:holin [Aureibacillus halotolerans]TDQ37668.1 A118-like holin Hol118 [Aureibacillus halotolerans]
MNEIMQFSTILVGIVTALVRLVRITSPAFPEQYIPLFSVFIGIICAVCGSGIVFASVTLKQAVWVGILAGLSSAGLFRIGQPRQKLMNKEDRLK